MRFSDRLVRCEACGVEFVYTVREQRKRAEKGKPAEPPAFCKGCRTADVRLAEAAGQEPETETEGQPTASPVAMAAPEATAATAAAVESSASSTRSEPPADKPTDGRSGRKKRKQGGQRPDKGGRKGQRRASQKKKPPRQTELRIRHVGTVKWFDETRGYGFIAQDDGEELFVHTSGVLGPSDQALEQGQQVEYEIEHTSRGLQAVDVIQLP
jgi:CspA family cold shock protein